MKWNEDLIHWFMWPQKRCKCAIPSRKKMIQVFMLSTQTFARWDFLFKILVSQCISWNWFQFQNCKKYRLDSRSSFFAAVTICNFVVEIWISHNSQNFHWINIIQYVCGCVWNQVKTKCNIRNFCSHRFDRILEMKWPI